MAAAMILSRLEKNFNVELTAKSLKQNLEPPHMSWKRRKPTPSLTRRPNRITDDIRSNAGQCIDIFIFHLCVPGHMSSSPIDYVVY
jgi:hypothetical protein